MITSSLRDWVVLLRPQRGAPVRLFCFPSAGSGVSLYRPFVTPLGSDVEVCGVQAPGREHRLSEAPFTRLDALVDALEPKLTPFLDRPFALFGHSLGSLVAFAVARRLRARGGAQPIALFVSARRAPHMPLLHPPLHKLGDRQLIAEVRRYNGTPAAILDNAELMELFLPTIRADFQIHETYAHADQPPLDVPITALGGLADPIVPVASLDAWRDHTRVSFASHLFQGDHFYLNDHREALLSIVRAEIGRRLALG